MYDNKRRRASRIRYKLKRVSGGEVCRLSIFRSSQHIDLQVIDDRKGHTLASASTKEKEYRGKKMSKKEASSLMGTIIAKRASEAGIQSLVFDKGPYKYCKNGCLDLIASAVRSAGIKV